MKPVESIKRALRNSSKAGDMIADFFGGSGGTLIAFERRERSARLMEIDPRYVDVIVRRWRRTSGSRRSWKSMAAPSQKLPLREQALRPEIERCRREIAAIESELRSGHPNLQGLVVALMDWRMFNAFCIPGGQTKMCRVLQKAE